MALELFAGAAMGVAFDKLSKVVEVQYTRIAGFKHELKHLETTLTDMKPKLIKIVELRNVLDRSVEEKITRYLTDAANLVLKCSKVKWWNAYHKSVYANKLISLDNDLVRFFQVNAQADAAIDGMEILVAIGIMQKKLDKLLAAGSGELSGWCSVPGLPEVIVGLDVHLVELKSRLLKDETRVLVISAPGGCGKTTLAKMVCHDDEIKGTFGENILYVTVSRVSSLKIIAQKLFKHYGKNDHVFQTEEEAKNQIENLIRGKTDGSDQKMLLVLDDVWSESESLVQDLKFQIPGYKVLVTSRFSFPRFNSTYELTLLNHEDAKALFCYYAFPNNMNPARVPDHLVNEMVIFCKKFPLALNLVGLSTCGQPLSKWRTILKKRSQGQSILQSDSSLLLCLQTSLDALDELPTVKKCFLDLGSFPEDERIKDTVLMDMWSELYNDDGEIMDASEYLLELSSRNLVNLTPTGKHVGELEGYDNEHYVTQHDLLRELAIHQSGQGHITERERLFLEIQSNVFPAWWTKQTEQPINARVMSITTDESFSSNWQVEVLILNIRSKNYTLPKFIERMSQLKVLIITGYGVYPTQLENLQFFSSLSNLRIIRFEHVSVSPSIQVIFTLQNLKKLTFSTCKIDEAFSSSWCDLKAPKVDVLILNIRSNKYSLPNFINNMSQLKVLIITGYGVYPSLIDNLHFLRSLTNLRRIRFEHVSISPSIQGIFELQNLKKLTFVTCKIGNALTSGTTEYPYMLPNLIDLEIDRCDDLKELPEWLCTLIRLQKLSITNCHELDDLPSGLGSISNLHTLRLHCCTKLQKLPKSIGRLYNLSLLDISDCLSISVLREEFGELRGLTVLKMSGCLGLQELPVSMSKLSQLDDVICNEETSYLWESIRSELSKVKINIVEEDRVGSFLKIFQ